MIRNLQDDFRLSLKPWSIMGLFLNRIIILKKKKKIQGIKKNYVKSTFLMAVFFVSNEHSEVSHSNQVSH